MRTRSKLTNIHKCMHPLIHTSIDTYIYTSIHTYIHIYIYTYIPIYIHTYIHTYIRTVSKTSIPVSRDTGKDVQTGIPVSWVKRVNSTSLGQECLSVTEWRFISTACIPKHFQKFVYTG